MLTFEIIYYYNLKGKEVFALNLCEWGALNILVTLDSGYVNQLCVMLKSLITVHKNDELNIYVAHSSLTEEDFKKINTILAGSNCHVFNTHVDDSLFADTPASSRYPKEMYYRVLASTYLPNHIDRILYLDPDIVIINPIDKLYHMDMGSNYFAAASHVGEIMTGINKLRLDMHDEMPDDGRYINSGVLLMNLELLREEQDPQEVYDYIEERKMFLILPDQDVINGVYAHKTAQIDPLYYNLSDRYLNIHNLSFKNLDNQVDLHWVAHNTSIIHYYGSNKPWEPSYSGDLDGFYYYFENLAQRKLREHNLEL